MLYAEDFSPNTPQGACPHCHGLGRLYDVTEASMVPDDSLTVRERAVAAWPSAWQGQNLRDILTTLGHDIDVPWRNLPRKTREWILFTDEQPTVPVYPGLTVDEARRARQAGQPPSYMGTFTGARRYVMQTFATSQSAMMKRKVSKFMVGTRCPVCHGKRLKPESLSVTFCGLDIGDLARLPLDANVQTDRKSTRLNSSHTVISYAVFCLKKKKNKGERFRDLYTTAVQCNPSSVREPTSVHTLTLPMTTPDLQWFTYHDVIPINTLLFIKHLITLKITYAPHVTIHSNPHRPSILLTTTLFIGPSRIIKYF